MGMVQNPEVFKVALARFALGVWKDEKEAYDGKGDIAAGVSCDTIAMEGRIREPVRHRGQLYCVTSQGGGRGCEQAKAYKLLDRRLFPRTPTTYTDKVCGHESKAEAARNDPFGFYDGMTVTHGGREYILTGPPLIFEGDPTLDTPQLVQGSLF